MSRFISRKMNRNARKPQAERTARRQAANFERFMQEKADVFQVTDVKDQAMFWVLQ